VGELYRLKIGNGARQCPGVPLGYIPGVQVMKVSSDVQGLLNTIYCSIHGINPAFAATRKKPLLLLLLLNMKILAQFIHDS